MNFLILGGTNDALRLANSLFQKSIPIIYSLAGLVRVPEKNYPIITGGFSQHGGLDHYIKKNGIVGIIDATHPYANKISDEAYDAALNNQIPYWQYDRPIWERQTGDTWLEYNDWNELFSMLQDKKSIFITTGQLTALILNALPQKLSAKVLLRTVLEPAVALQKGAGLAENIHWIQAIGPFTLEDEIALMQKHAIDALVSKNSGGDATSAKLLAARQLQVPVYLLKRPEYRRFQNENASVEKLFSQLDACEEAVLQYFNKSLLLEKPS